MRLLSLQVDDFRNLQRADLSPSAGATVLIGANGQGKTNLLEALYLLVTLRPLRAQRLGELVRFGCERARVVGRMELSGAERELAVEVTAGGREAFVDGKAVAGLADYFGGVSVVAFTPDDLSVVKGSPDGRRKLLDRAVFNRFPAHLEAMRAYARALRQRNRALKEGAPRALIDSYGELLARSGAQVWLRRRALLAELSPRVAQGFEAIAPGDGGASLALDSALGDGEDKALEGTCEVRAIEALLAALQRATARDLERGFTSVGPHVDDLELKVGGRSARLYASQGQQRALVLAFKTAEIENLREMLGAPPLLLLDDVSSELDPARNAFLMRYLRGAGLQVFLTTTDERLVSGAEGEGAARYTLRAGCVSVG